MWINELSDDLKRAFLIAQSYENSRRKIQFGYKLFPEWNKEILETPNFKTFTTIAKWLSEQHWKISWNEVSWIGYIEFCFKILAPTVPLPGQLRNKMLFSKYMLSIPDVKDSPERTMEDLKRIYSQVLRTDLRSLIDIFIAE